MTYQYYPEEQTRNLPRERERDAERSSLQRKCRCSIHLLLPITTDSPFGKHGHDDRVL